MQGWIGRDVSKFWWKHEGSWTPEEDTGESETDVLYAHLITPFWNAQAGLRYSNEWSEDDYEDLVAGVVLLAAAADLDPDRRVPGGALRGLADADGDLHGLALVRRPHTHRVVLARRDDVASVPRPADDLDLVVDETFPTETSDLSTQLGKVRSEDADVLLLAAHQKHSIIMAKQLESQQVNVDMAMGTVGTLNDAFKEEVGANGNYIYGPSSWASNASFEDRVFGTTGDFVSAIQSEYDYMPDYHSAAATGVVQTFVRAFESVDEVAPTPVRDAIQNIDFTCAYGGVRFADNGVINKDMLVYQWQPDGGRSIVWPENVQQTAPKYPMPSWSER